MVEGGCFGLSFPPEDQMGVGAAVMYDIDHRASEITIVSKGPYAFGQMGVGILGGLLRNQDLEQDTHRGRAKENPENLIRQKTGQSKQAKILGIEAQPGVGIFTKQKTALKAEFLFSHVITMRGLTLAF
ncbi:hypothetical protein [Sulfidibacter corallicola]|uniref:Uncharacterized protein n=1 Tax=Sulfidibacter corallicola TaxID=2818388 RepID=A0A8A4TVC4_SULCO|nr:hypothetical protein [Sulfidibacter corallicola]QTD53118.1 hypothetical protein J3U87_11710 [Sulfidibacter corallicola]